MTEKQKAVIEAAQRFVTHERNTGEGIDDLWESNSLDIPVEFMALVEAVDELQQEAPCEPQSTRE